MYYSLHSTNSMKKPQNSNKISNVKCLFKSECTKSRGLVMLLKERGHSLLNARMIQLGCGKPQCSLLNMRELVDFDLSVPLPR